MAWGPERETSQLKDRSYELRLSFDENGAIAAVEVVENVCSEVRGTHRKIEMLRDGFMYQCVDDEELFNQF